jgi:hypothetical protein
MKSVRPIICASLLTLALSTSAVAGNIGGMRTTSAGNIGGLRTSRAGNIGGLRTNATGNIGGLRNEVSVTTRESLAFELAGNIGNFLSILFTAF